KAPMPSTSRPLPPKPKNSPPTKTTPKSSSVGKTPSSPPTEPSLHSNIPISPHSPVPCPPLSRHRIRASLPSPPRGMARMRTAQRRRLLGRWVPRSRPNPLDFDETRRDNPDIRYHHRSMHLEPQRFSISSQG